MTGFGKVTAELSSKKVTVEVKSLNSKQLDLSTRIPSIYREKEMEVRSLLLQKLERGKVEFNIYIESTDKSMVTQINASAMADYYRQIVEVSTQLGIALPNDLLSTLLRMPDVIKTDTAEADEAEWNEVRGLVEQAIQHLIDFRVQEGVMLQRLFEQKIRNIAALLEQVSVYEVERVERSRAGSRIICRNWPIRIMTKTVSSRR